MSEEVKLKLTVLSKKEFGKVVDTSFSTFTPPAPPAEDPDTVAELFRLYDKLFFSIPVYGPSNSLEALVKKALELYELDQTIPEIQPLLDEIAELRQRLLEANQQILSLSGTVNG